MLCFWAYILRLSSALTKLSLTTFQQKGLHRRASLRCLRAYRRCLINSITLRLSKGSCILGHPGVLLEYLPWRSAFETLHTHHTWATRLARLWEVWVIGACLSSLWRLLRWRGPLWQIVQGTELTRESLYLRLLFVDYFEIVSHRVTRLGPLNQF